MNWIRVEDDMPPMPPHAQDGATERVLVWVEKTYYPHVYPGYYEYTEDGSQWEVDGLHHLTRDDWKVTHWMKEPDKPGTRQRCTNHKWLDTNQQLPRWPPVKVYKCGLCCLTGKLPSRLTPNGFPQYDLSDMTYEGCPENGQTK